MTKPPIAVLLAIGDELLNGDVRDINLFRLSRWLTRLGVYVVEARLIRDDVEEMVAAFQSLLASGPDVFIISGGLGPTEDDRTLTVLADALALPLIESPEARQMVEAQYERLFRQGHRGPEHARRKMARLPEGATPLSNPRGTAPGIALTHGPTQIYCLPGVPAELEVIFAQQVVPALQGHFELGAWIEEELVVACQDEAAVAAPLRKVAPRHPDVYLKSLARSFPEAEEGALRIIAAALAPNEEVARARAEAALRDLKETLAASGLQVCSSSFDFGELHAHQSRKE